MMALSNKVLPLVLFLGLLSVLYRADSADGKVTSSRQDLPRISAQKQSDSDDSQKSAQQKQNTFSVLACVTWWSHDAVGYHPAMSMFLENTSGHEIVGGEIPFQGRFTDVRTGEVTVAREYRRAPIRDHERVCIFLRGPKYYELPIDSESWPTIECKAMCRLNNTKVEDLFLAHLAKITMTDEDAQAQLVAQAGRSPFFTRGGIQLEETGDVKSTGSKSKQAMHASPGSFSTETVKTSQSKRKEGESKKKSNAYVKNLPAVGSDFYAFDQLFGQAAQVQTRIAPEDLTWAHYQSEGVIKDVFVGSRNSNKADFIIIVLDGILKEKELMPFAKLLASCNKSDSITPFTHSVKYLPAGRSEIMTTAFKDDKILAFQVENNNKTDSVLVVSRLPYDTEQALNNFCKRVGFLKFLEL